MASSLCAFWAVRTERAVRDALSASRLTYRRRRLGLELAGGCDRLGRRRRSWKGLALASHLRGCALGRTVGTRRRVLTVIKLAKERRVSPAGDDIQATRDVASVLREGQRGRRRVRCSYGGPAPLAKGQGGTEMAKDVQQSRINRPVLQTSRFTRTPRAPLTRRAFT